MKASTSVALVLFTVLFRHTCFRIATKYPNFGTLLNFLPGLLMFSGNAGLVECALAYNLYIITTSCEILLTGTD